MASASAATVGGESATVSSKDDLTVSLSASVHVSSGEDVDLVPGGRDGGLAPDPRRRLGTKSLVWFARVPSDHSCVTPSNWPHIRDAVELAPW